MEVLGAGILQHTVHHHKGGRVPCQLQCSGSRFGIRGFLDPDQEPGAYKIFKMLNHLIIILLFTTLYLSIEFL